MDTKRCGHCKETKPLSEFTKDRRNKDGLNNYCRACKKLYNDAQKEYHAERRKMRYIKNVKYKAMVFDDAGSFTKQDIVDCLDFFEHECAYSGVPLTKGYSLDHVVPLSKGGANDIHNIVPCLEVVNIRKAAQDWELWYVDQPYYSEARHEKIKQWLGLKENSALSKP